MNEITSKDDNTVIMSDKYLIESGVQGGKVLGTPIMMKSVMKGMAPQERP